MNIGMSMARAMKFLILKKPPTNGDERQTDAHMADGRRRGEGSNPYLSARRTWNEHMGDLAASRQTWQMLGQV